MPTGTRRTGPSLPTAEPFPTPQPRGRRQKALQVLLVDDSVAVRARLATLLSECPGIEVAGEASNGPAGVFEAKRLAPDAVVLDIRMPGGYGLDALETMQSWPDPPVVIVLTNYPTESYRRWCLAHGADWFLDKSTEFDRVPEVLAALRERPPR